MRDFAEKSRIFCFLIVAVFLAALSSAVSFAAESPAASSTSALPAYTYSAGTTVETLQGQLDALGKGQRLSVTRSDGSLRANGPLQSGDVVEVFDQAGNLQSRVTAAIASDSPSAGSSSSASPSSAAPDSSQNGSSSLTPVSSGSAGSAVSSRQGEVRDYVFSSPVTVENLKTEIGDKISAGCVLRITSVSGGHRESGRVCTGDVIRVLNPDGSEQSAVKAVVLGDLTGGGEPDNQAKTLLYRYLTGQQELDAEQAAAADLNQDGKIDTSDLLLLKKRLTGSAKD